MNKPLKLNTANINGKEYVLVPREEYLKAKYPNLEDAVLYATKSLGDKLRKIREYGGFTQQQLAEKLGCSQSMVANAESGKTVVGGKYLQRVCGICGAEPDDERNT